MGKERKFTLHYVTVKLLLPSILIRWYFFFFMNILEVLFHHIISLWIILTSVSKLHPDVLIAKYRVARPSPSSARSNHWFVHHSSMTNRIAFDSDQHTKSRHVMTYVSTLYLQSSPVKRRKLGNQQQSVLFSVWFCSERYISQFISTKTLIWNIWSGPPDLLKFILLS